jgi:hypothetical protein
MSEPVVVHPAQQNRAQIEAILLALDPGLLAQVRALAEAAGAPWLLG